MRTEDSGTYTCRLVNSQREISSFRLWVDPEAGSEWTFTEETSNQPRRIRITSGSRLELDCQVAFKRETSPELADPHVFWRKVQRRSFVSARVAFS